MRHRVVVCRERFLIKVGGGAPEESCQGVFPSLWGHGGSPRFLLSPLKSFLSICIYTVSKYIQVYS